MNDETNTEQTEKQQELDMPEKETEEVTPADTQANEEEVPVMKEDSYDFGSSEVGNDKNFTPDEHQDETVTDQSDTTSGFTISEFGEHSNNEQQHEGDDDFGFYEDFFRDYTREHNLSCIRYRENNYFKITINAENADKNTTHIQIDHGRNLIMNAHDKNNTPIVPDQQMFDAIAMLAAKKKASITFGNIESDEYAARLYIACRNNEVPMRDIPYIALDKLGSPTKEEYEALANEKETTENQQNQTTDKATTDNQEEVPVAEYDNDSNVDSDKATEHTEQNTTSTSASEGVQDQKEVKEDSKNNFASDQPKKNNQYTNLINSLRGCPTTPGQTNKKCSPVTGQREALLNRIISKKSNKSH